MQLHPLVGDLEEALCALEQVAAKVGDEPECVDVCLEHVGHDGELVGLGGAVELCLVAHQVVDAGVIGGVARGEVVEVQVRRDLHGLDGHAEPTRYPGALAVELAEQHAPLVPAAEVVVDLQRQGALPRTHRAEAEPQDAHRAPSLAHRG